ncbi:MAG: alpha/beta hydrolase, partial [Steroidobacteraceae bacterium]
MALFAYFPNYIWNLSVAMALESGGKIGEIIDMCQPIRDAAAGGADAGTPQFMTQWVSMAEQLSGLADEDIARGRAFSASDKLERAALYLLVAERMQAQGSAGREATYARARAIFDRSSELGKMPRERVEIPLDVAKPAHTMPALYTRAPGSGRRPLVVYCNGLDSCKELL